MAGQYRFSFGPWNVHEGADPFGPTVRSTIAFAEKLKMYKDLGFEGVQFHDDDAVPEMNDLSPEQIVKKAEEVRKMLDGEGLAAEFVAPRLWEDSRTIDGGYTSNDPECRQYAKDRSRRAIDIAAALDTKLIVLWLAREGTYIREAKDSKVAVDRLVEAIDDMLLAYLTKDPSRVGVNIETAHAILAGLDPSDEMGFALAYDRLYTVHLNDQNGLKFDEDKSFGSVNLRRAFNQVRILDKYDYGTKGEFVGLDVKAMRTQKAGVATKHLSNSRTVFLKLVDLARSLDEGQVDKLIAERDYEELDMLIMSHLLGK